MSILTVTLILAPHLAPRGLPLPTKPTLGGLTGRPPTMDSKSLESGLVSVQDWWKLQMQSLCFFLLQIIGDPQARSTVAMDLKPWTLTKMEINNLVQKQESAALKHFGNGGAEGNLNSSQENKT